MLLENMHEKQISPAYIIVGNLDTHQYTHAID